MWNIKFRLKTKRKKTALMSFYAIDSASLAATKSAREASLRGGFRRHTQDILMMDEHD